MTATYHTTGEINAARETLFDLADQIESWIKALEVNRKRAEEQGHDRQAQRLEDAQSYYRAVRDMIVYRKITMLNDTVPMTVSFPVPEDEPCRE